MYIDILSRERDIKQLLQMAEWFKSMPVKEEKLYIKMAEVLIRFGQKQSALELLNSILPYLPSNKEISDFLQKLGNGSDEFSVNYYRERFDGVPPEKAISEIENILFLPEYEDNISIRLFLDELTKRQGTPGGPLRSILSVSRSRTVPL